MGVALEAEFARPKAAPQKHRAGKANNDQRNELLPIHVGKIVQAARSATKMFCGTDNLLESAFARRIVPREN